MISHRQPPGITSLLEEHLSACLCTLYELVQYAVLPQSAHYRSAVLLCKSSDRFDVKAVSSMVMQSMKDEWSMILSLEKDGSTQALLHQHCPHVKWQSFREVMTAAESAKYECNDDLQSLLAAWHPAVQSSSNCEDIFNEVQDCIKRSGKADAGSLANMAAVSIRGCHRKCEGTEMLRGVVLKSEDFEGNHVRGLKQSIYKPEACPASLLANGRVCLLSAVFAAQARFCLCQSQSVHLHAYVRSKLSGAFVC